MQADPRRNKINKPESVELKNKRKKETEISQMMYKTRMSSDFFDPKGLETRTGLLPQNWHLAIIKELIDNALDAIEENASKEIVLEYRNSTLKIFDNGNGISLEGINSIYDFNNYASANRHVITPSRGKLGNGLKSIIGICAVKEYSLLWHTSEGIILKANLNTDMVADIDLEADFIEIGLTDKKGIEIQGIILGADEITSVIWQYVQCNPDVSFVVNLDNFSNHYKPLIGSVSKTNETSLAFYNYQDFLRLLTVQDKTETYKSFLEKYFGTRIKNSSQIKGKIENLNLDEVKQDFISLKGALNTKPYTLLKKHLVGFENKLEVSIHPKTNSDDLPFPCLIEFRIDKLEEKRRTTIINCYVNNSITYFDGESITYTGGFYKISNCRKESYSRNLEGLLADYTDYAFSIHFIAPYLNFKDYGKTEIDITDFIEVLVDAIRKSLAKEKKKYELANVKNPSQKSLAEKYMTDAFLLASTNGKYAITARQMYYKLRELAGRECNTWESKSTYSSFTQRWLTAWLDDHEQYEDKINFSERGNFYVDSNQRGLGSANVRMFLNEMNGKKNKFLVYGGIQDNLYIDDTQFDVRFRYDKALYIEKTGFDTVFKAERLDEKYNLLIVSGQGYASREARRLLYHLQQQGLKLYCMHDLDADGVEIFSSMCKANDKFKFDLDMVDLGVSPEDVAKYGIVPEVVDKVDAITLSQMDYEHRMFFDKGSKSQRVELNAFSTEQLLELISNKLYGLGTLPTVNLSQSLQLDEQALREVAFMRVIKAKYADQLSEISLPCDLSKFDGKLTLTEAKKAIPQIEEDLVSQYEQEILKQIAI